MINGFFHVFFAVCFGSMSFIPTSLESDLLFWDGSQLVQAPVIRLNRQTRPSWTCLGTFDGSALRLPNLDKTIRGGKSFDKRSLFSSLTGNSEERYQNILCTEKVRRLPKEVGNINIDDSGYKWERKHRPDAIKEVGGTLKSQDNGIINKPLNNKENEGSRKIEVTSPEAKKLFSGNTSLVSLENEAKSYQKSSTSKQTPSSEMTGKKISKSKAAAVGLTLFPIGPFGYYKENCPIFFYTPAIIPPLLGSQENSACLKESKRDEEEQDSRGKENMISSALKFPAPVMANPSTTADRSPPPGKNQSSSNVSSSLFFPSLSPLNFYPSPYLFEKCKDQLMLSNTSSLFQ